MGYKLNSRADYTLILDLNNGSVNTYALNSRGII